MTVRRILISVSDYNPYADPPVYNSLAQAMASIEDNSLANPYQVELLSGTHYAKDITLKDGVDIVRSPLAGSMPIIETNCLSSAPADIFKTFSGDGSVESNFPIRCAIRGLGALGRNLRYPFHGDHNRHPDIDIQIEDCILKNNDPATTSEISNYGLGLGVYGGQKYTIKSVDMYGRYDPAESNPVLQQGAGFNVHNRAGQTKPCEVRFIDSNTWSGFYGGRIVDYGSGQKDVIDIQGGVLWGEFAQLLRFANTGVTTASLTTRGNVAIKIVRTRQDVGGAVLYDISPTVISGFSMLYKAVGAIDRGDLVSVGVFQKTAKVAELSRYRHRMGVALHSAENGQPVSVQEFGIAAVKFDPALTASQVEVTNSSAGQPGIVRAAVAGDGIIGTTAATTANAALATGGLALIHLQYAGTKH